jgi:hypothetical protein
MNTDRERHVYKLMNKEIDRKKTENYVKADTFKNRRVSERECKRLSDREISQGIPNIFLIRFLWITSQTCTVCKRERE